ncbi:MAG: AMP-binding protein [Microthrixaceae bacterium]
MNVAEVILTGRVGDTTPADDDPMFISIDERDRRRVTTRADARAEVAAIAAALRSEGVVAGDRVAVWLPNTEVAMLVMLAAASIGAVFSSTSPDFGVDGVLDRFGQIEPKVLVASDGYTYGSREFDRREELAGIIAGLPGLERTVVLGFLDERPDLDRLAATAPVVGFEAWVKPHRGAELAFEQLPFDHPWYVLFSSGTTGVPKCIVHRSGGVLLQHLKEHQLHCDIRAGDRVCYFTTAGWMMWNWLASVPASGAVAVLCREIPSNPAPGGSGSSPNPRSWHSSGYRPSTSAVAKAGTSQRSRSSWVRCEHSHRPDPRCPRSRSGWIYSAVAPGCGPGAASGVDLGWNRPVWVFRGRRPHP